MSIQKSILIIVSLCLGFLIAADIAGVLLNSIFDIFAGRGKSTLLYYTVWFVAAIFAGLFYFSLSYSYVKANDFIKKNNWLIFILSLVISVLLLIFFNAKNQMGTDTDEYYVPGNSYMTYTFFITFILSSLFGWYLEKPTKVELK